MSSERSLPRAKDRRRPSRAWVAVALLLALFAAQAIGSLRQKSVTTDEITYIAAGYTHWRTGRFDFNTTNPPGVKLIAALPLLALDLELPARAGDLGRLDEVGQWRYARAFLYENRVDADRIVLVARLPIVALGAILGIYVFVWGRRLYGTRGGLFALALYTFCPNVLAHTRLAALDLGLAAFLFMATFHFCAHLRAPSWGSLLATGAALTCAVLSKTTAVLLVPAWGAWAAWRVWRNPDAGCWTNLRWVRRIDPTRARARQLLSLAVSLAALAGIGGVGLNVGYGFDGSFEPLSTRREHPEVYAKLPLDVRPARALVDLALTTPLPIPAPFLEVLRFQAGRTASGNRIYFAGRTSREGWWYVMPMAFLIKTPIPLLLLMAWALVSWARDPDRREAEALAVAIVVTVFGFFCYLKQNSIGLRYVLPIYPFLLLLAGRLLRDEVDLRRWTRVALAALALGHLASSARIYPHYLAYFNELIGGPRNGYRYLADSYLDWGQDLKGLKKYLESHDIGRIRLAFFGSADASYYGIDYDYLPSVGLAPKQPGEHWWFETKTEELPPFRPSGGPIAISATLLAGVFYPGYYQALHGLEPVDHVGYSILIFDPR